MMRIGVLARLAPIALATCAIHMVLATGANALTLDIAGEQLVGAFDVDVGGVLYDVEFLDGTCADVFGGCNEPSDFTFDNTNDALLASEALLDQVLIDGPLGLFDSAPELTSGCSDPFICWIYTPYLLAGLSAASGRVDNHAFPPDGVADGSQNVLLDLGAQTRDVWARWTPVPEPHSGALLGFGLLLLHASRRAKRRRLDVVAPMWRPAKSRLVSG